MPTLLVDDSKLKGGQTARPVPGYYTNVVARVATPGAAGVSEVQKIQVNNASAGTYTLTYAGNAITILFDAPAMIADEAGATVGQSLQSLLQGLGLGAVVVQREHVDDDYLYTLTFAAASANVADPVADGALLVTNQGHQHSDGGLVDVATGFSPAGGPTGHSRSRSSSPGGIRRGCRR